LRSQVLLEKRVPTRTSFDGGVFVFFGIFAFDNPYAATTALFFSLISGGYFPFFSKVHVIRYGTGKFVLHFHPETFFLDASTFSAPKHFCSFWLSFLILHVALRAPNPKGDLLDAARSW